MLKKNLILLLLILLLVLFGLFYWQKPFGDLSSALGNLTTWLSRTKQQTPGIVEQIKTYIVEPESETETADAPWLDLDSLSQVKEQIDAEASDPDKLNLSDLPDALPVPVAPAPAVPTPVLPAQTSPNLEQLAEQLDAITEQVEIMLAQAQELLEEPEIILATGSGPGPIEGSDPIPAEVSDHTLEIIAAQLTQITQQIETLITQTQQFISETTTQ